ncbi:RNA recognition motif domain-containing protein [Sarocladium implicatum]|nr:RNA recognition motif domain-containing protein [Sarocladium implicatum]
MGKRDRSQINGAATDYETTSQTKKPKVEERRSLFVRSLPDNATSESLTDFFSQHYPVKHATVVVDKQTNESRGFGFVTFADAEDAVAARDALDKQEWEGKRIRLEVAEPRQRDATKGPKTTPAGKPPARDEYEAPPKLIIRNLPWSIKTSAQLAQLFQSYGKIKFADLPQNKGKLKGFGFVTLRGKKNAAKALESVNGKEIDGRTLAVDWAVDKQTWDKQQHDEPAEDSDATSSEGESDEEEEDDNEDVEVNKEDKPRKDDDLDADLENFMKNHMQNMEDEEDEDEDEDEDEEDGGAKLDNKPAPKKLSNDNSCTVFVRNLPFTTNDEQLKGFFTHFGPVRYARVVMDKATDKPAGTGFVCFASLDDCKACVRSAPRPQRSTAGPGNKTSILLDENADPEGKYTLDGRLLQVAQAVNKEEASQLADTSMAQRHEKDKRRLYLLNEGAIGRNSALQKLLPDAEVQMRLQSAQQRKKMVQSNPSLHISLTRLALRNIPRNIGSKELKELARRAVVEFAKDVQAGRRQPLSKEENLRDGKDAKEKEKQRKLKGKGIIRQAKVVFESSQGSKVDEKSGAGKSRGYGFIEYTNHHWALMGLRYLNGHQLVSDTGKKQRLIVEFAIENAQVVQRRRATEEKSSQPSQKRDASAAADKKKADDKKEAEDAKPVSKRKARRQLKKAKLKADKAEAAAEGVKPQDGGEDPKSEMQQRLIGRKRLMRKKKAGARGKN